MATRKKKTDAEVKATITIAEAEADVKQRETHEKNMQKVVEEKGGNIPQGKRLNNKTYEYVCNDCLGDAVANGDMYCLYDEKLSETGKCSCGKLTTLKAILI